MPALQEPDDHRRAPEGRTREPHRRHAPREERGGRRRRDQQAEDKQRPHRPEGGDDGQGQQREHRHVGQSRVQAEHLSLRLVERQDEERPVEERDPGDGDCGGRSLNEQIRRSNAEDVAEQEGSEAGRERGQPRDDDHAQGQHPDEQETDGGVLPQAGLAVDECNACNHDERTGDRAEGQVEPQDERNAMPGRTPWASASPMKAMPRMTTQVPMSDEVTAASRPPRSACCMKWTENGSVNHSITVVRSEHRRSARRSCGACRRTCRPRSGSPIEPV